MDAAFFCPHPTIELLRRKRKALDDKNFSAYDAAVKALCGFYTDKCMYQEALDTFSEVSNVYKTRPQYRMERGRAERMIGEMYMYLENYTVAVQHVETFLSKTITVISNYPH